MKKETIISLVVAVHFIVNKNKAQLFNKAKLFNFKFHENSSNDFLNLRIQLFLDIM